VQKLEKKKFAFYDHFSQTDNISCEPAILKSYIMCTIFLTKESLHDIKIMLHPEVKFNIFSWRVQQENGRFCHLSRKEEER